LRLGALPHDVRRSEAGFLQLEVEYDFRVSGRMARWSGSGTRCAVGGTLDDFVARTAARRGVEVQKDVLDFRCNQSDAIEVLEY